VVQVPQKLEVRMVNASALHDYEAWAVATSVLFALWTNFATSCVQDAENKTMWLMVVIFTALLVPTAVRARSKRASLDELSTGIEFYAAPSPALPPPPPSSTLG
jgi:hypothetical protein